MSLRAEFQKDKGEDSVRPWLQFVGFFPFRGKLRGCDLTDEGCSALTSALKSNPSHLKHLYLSENKLGDSGVENLSDLLMNPQCNLEKLDLKGCGITDVSSLTQCLTNTKALQFLKELDLRNNTIRDSEQLRDVIRDSNCKLRAPLSNKTSREAPRSQQQDNQNKVSTTNPERMMAASLLRRDKKSTAAHLKADLKRTDNSSGLRQLQELLDSVLNPERGSDPEALEWCKWLLAGGDGFDEFCRTVRSYDNATLCGLVWTANFVAYRCRTCGISPCMSLCAECFNNGDHTGHDFNMFRSQAGGACDCGDGNVMRESGFCSRHRLKTGENVPSVPRDLLLMSEMVLPRFIITIIQYLRDGYTEPESAADRDLQKVLQQLEPHISFLEELTKMGGAMRTVLTKILTNQQTFKELSMGQEENVYAKRNYEKYLSALKSSGLVSVEEKGAGGAGAGAADTPAGAGALSLLGATAAASLEDSSKEEDQDGLQGVGQRKRVKLSSSTKDPSIMDTLKHKCFLEELLFWTIKYEFPQKMVTFLLNMLPDQDYKITFTKTFVQHYAFIMKTLMKSHESDTMSNRIVHISVQLFSNEELARHVTEECQLLDIMVTVLLYMMESCLIKSELQDEENNRHVVVNCGEALLKNNTYWPLVSDFINILSHQSVAKRFLEDHSLLLLWMSFVSFFQGMNLNKRELNEHVEFESQTYYAAFAAELEACAQPMWGLLTHCKVKETQEYTKTVVRYCLETLQMWFDAIGFVDEPALNQLTFHLPLHRYYAMFLSKGVKCQGLDLDSLLPDQEMLMKIMVHPLQIQASLSEIHSNMWVRNGLQIKGQAMTYVQSHFCNSMIDPDIYLLQVCASRLDPDYFISSVFERFKVVDLLTMASQHQNAVLDSEQERPMLEGALTFLVILSSLRIHLGMSDDEILRAEMVSQLCMNDRTHSSLLDLIPENPNPKSGVVPGSCSFEEMLSAVADFKAPVFEPGGSMQQGMYTPKAEVWEKEFDPIMVILRTVYRRDVQSAMDRYAAFLKQSGVHTGNPWPPYKERTPLHPCYKGLVRLLHCKTLHIVIFTLLYKIWMDHQNMSEHVLCMVLYLIELGLDNQVQDDKVEEEPCIEEHCHDSWFPGTSLLSNLHHVINFVRVRVPETAPEVERKRERERERETPPSTSSESATFGQNLREAQVFSLVAERRRKFQEIINRSNHEASQAVRPKSSSSRWLPPGSPPQLVTEILEIRESMLSLLVKLHQKLSAKQNSLSLSWLAEVDPAHHAHGDGLTAIERILAKASARSRHSKRCLQEICGKVCPPIPPKKNSPGDKKSMDKEERRQRARERQQKLLAEFASRQKSFMETAMDVGKDIVATKIAPKSTIYRFIKNFKERGSILVKKASGRPRKSSKRQDRLLKRIQLRDRSATSAELAQEWQQAGVSASARTVRRRLLEDGLVSRRAAKKPLLSTKNTRDRLIFCRKYSEWTSEDWGKVIFSDEAPFRLFGASGKRLVRRRKGDRYHQSCVMPTVKHPDTIHVWGCFSSKGVGSLTILPKNTAMN
ncbi:E3 ubiquitin-protein ligase ubr3 [Anabarilius grahami]|uniref:E3 ubiquitin-protein ligase n=1 Tax=Anabarilius grahami TaxID=495550 RepID=A0A3N0Y907_ANAGA|nr:E3 ubiquitin-protein ligase ubr3 [Anabarilius grahami]